MVEQYPYPYCFEDENGDRFCVIPLSHELEFMAEIQSDSEAKTLEEELLEEGFQRLPDGSWMKPID